MSATPAEIAALRRRYLWMATSIFFLDLGIALIFRLVNGGWSDFWISEGPGVVLLLGINWLLARRLFEPINRFLQGAATFNDTERRLTQLPLLTARWAALFAFILYAFRNSISWWLPSPTPGLQGQTIADYITVCLVLPVFYFTYTYFVVSDYLARLCSFIFERYGRNLGLFFGSYTLKLMVALLVISVAPLSAIVVDLFSYDGERLQAEILVDVASAVMGVAITAYYISRSLLQPITILSSAMSKVAGGNLEIRVPVTSNDEVGELTGRFNDMVGGLREREQIRETFGRYVDENVAAAILRRQGDGQRSGEIAEATILFTDIASFTTIAEYLAPHELVTALNDYLDTVLAPIRHHGGVVNTFIGDGLFASFNMPLACDDHPAAAVRAAIDIQRAVGSRTFGDQGVALATRIGISTGPVIGGDVGTGNRMSFTLLGDTVNLAARLEELNKEYGTRILASESTRAACGRSFAFQPLGKVSVRGRSEAVAVFSIDPLLQEGP
ncbi:adenylate/guanylate cyclase domain-containing protein [Reyranella sp.]|uniref:adenylate/guanylate cyclase domain-containing protein n=1 Tax=Reyranella sp. TaxID=1929291 RepID=UPI002F9414EA